MITFFKARKSNDGFLCQFSLSEVEKRQRDGSTKEALEVYMNFVSQTGYDDRKHLGSFKGGDRTAFKLGEKEINGFRYAILKEKTVSYFHSWNDNKTQIVFGPYVSQHAHKNDPFKGFRFGLSVTQNGEKRVIALTPDEAYQLENFLKLANDLQNGAAIQQNIEEYKANRGQRQRNNGSRQTRQEPDEGTMSASEFENPGGDQRDDVNFPDQEENSTATDFESL